MTYIQVVPMPEVRIISLVRVLIRKEADEGNPQYGALVTPVIVVQLLQK